MSPCSRLFRSSLIKNHVVVQLLYLQPDKKTKTKKRVLKGAFRRDFGSQGLITQMLTSLFETVLGFLFFPYNEYPELSQCLYKTENPKWYALHRFFYANESVHE